MEPRKHVNVTRDVEGMQIPSGQKVTVAAGMGVTITQTLGGNFTVLTDHGYLVRIDGKDAEAIGEVVPPPDASPLDGLLAGPERLDENSLRDRLRGIFDPEIPVNIVDLGLIYECTPVKLDDGGTRVDVKLSMTAPGCGMGDALRLDVEKTLLSTPGVTAADVQLVWEPAWSADRMSDAAKLQLGML